MKTINWKYTLGEILIVIIGISIAFSMNKCAENSKQTAQENQYLVNLKSDIEADKIKLVEIITELEQKIATSAKVIPVLASESANKMSYVSDIFSLAQISNFNPNDVTYQTLINSGDLKLINDFELKKAIQEHYSNYKIMMKDYERQEIIHKDYLGPYFIHNINFDDFKKGIFAFEDEKLLKSIIQSMNGSFSIKLKATQKGIESCDQLLEKLPK